MPRRQRKKAKQPPFILLDHNVQIDVADQLSRLARFQRVGEGAPEPRFRHDATDTEIYQGSRHFLFVTHDLGFLRPERLPSQHGGVLVFICPPDSTADALREFLYWWGPRRNLLKNRVFRLTASGGVEFTRNGSVRPIQRGPTEPERY